MKSGVGRTAACAMALGAMLAGCGDDSETSSGTVTKRGCDLAVTVQDPGEVTGDTRGGDHRAEGSCITGEAPEAYFAVTASVTGMLDLGLDSTADLGMYARTTCALASTEIGCADDGTAGVLEALSVPVTAGQAVWVIVDGYDVDQSGAFTLSVKSRAIECGDGRVEGAETCDPPDGGLTCTAGCQKVPEICGDGVDNDLDGLIDCEDASDCASAPECPLAATCGGAPALVSSPDTGDASTGPGFFAGSCTGGKLSPEALRSYDPPGTGVLLITLQSATDQGIYVRSSCVDPSSEIGCLDDKPGGIDETLVVPVQAGDALTLFVDAASPAQAGPFTLLTSFEPTSEAEPNNTPATATDHSDAFIGAIWPAEDVDLVRVVVPGPSSTLAAAISDFGNGDCMNFKLDSTLEILGPDGSTRLAFNDDTGNFCSSTQATGLAAGTYYLRIAASRVASKPTFAYRLSVQIN